MRLKTFIRAVAFVLLPAAATAGYLRDGHYTLNEFYAAIRAVEEVHRDLVSVTEFGKSVEGRPLLLIKIAKPGGGDSEVLITGTVHASEWTGGRVALAIAERLASGYGSDQWITGLLEDTDFYIAPLMNPDGYARADRHLDWGWTSARDNARHVDLNRNWPYPVSARPHSLEGRLLGGSNLKWDPNYRGPRPLSEPENRALDELVKTHDFFLVIDFHTTGGRFSYAWSYTGERPPHRDVYEAMGAAFRERQYLYKYEVHQSYDWYQIVGASKDWFYGNYGALALTVEVGKPSEFKWMKIGPVRALNPFWHSNPLEAEAWIANDRDATLYAVEKCRALTGGRPARPMDIEWVAR